MKVLPAINVPKVPQVYPEKCEQVLRSRVSQALIHKPVVVRLAYGPFVLFNNMICSSSYCFEGLEDLPSATSFPVFGACSVVAMMTARFFICRGNSQTTKLYPDPAQAHGL